MIGGDEDGHPWHCDQLVELDRTMARLRIYRKVEFVTLIVYCITCAIIILL